MADKHPDSSAGKASKPASIGKAPTISVTSTDAVRAASFAQELFAGQFAVDKIMPYFEQPENMIAAGDSMVAKAKNYCQEFVFADRIDQHALLPPGIVKGMGNIGVLGMTVDKKYGGNKMSTSSFCRVLEIIGGHCGSTAAMVRLQSCLVLNLLQTYGTAEQQEQWIPAIVSGDKTGAVAITEELAGSDIHNIHTAADRKPSGKGYKISGQKRWIANGGNADLFIVLARTPDDYRPTGNVSSFLVPAESAGITVETQTENKLGLKGLSIGTITFEKVNATDSDLLGNEGAGIEMVQSSAILDRIAFAATAVGGLKFLLESMVAQANTRTQFGQTIGNFDQVKQKIANVAADLYALESTVYHTAAEFDCDEQSLAVESMILKLFASETLYRAVNDAMDICGGKSVFNHRPLARFFRDVRHSLTSEGSNDLLRKQIASHGFGTQSSAPRDEKPNRPNWLQAAEKMLPTSPTIEVKHEHLRFHARWLANHIKKFGRNCQSTGGSDRLDCLQQSRVADLATQLLVSSCVFSKLSALMVNGTIPEPEKRFEFDTGALFLQHAKLANVELFDQLKVNLDDDQTSVANQWLSHKFDAADWPIAASVSTASPTLSDPRDPVKKSKV
jgi:alkylation response protein AidB-like acyl-CoA dehydrogenase